MLSSKGSASVAPSPRKMVRRGKHFFVAIRATPTSSLFTGTRDVFRGRPIRSRIRLLRPPHLERHALDYAQNNRRPAVIACGRPLHDRSYSRPIVIFNSSAKSVSQEFLGDCCDELLTTTQ